jgi:outer membrane immunogenic protein
LLQCDFYAIFMPLGVPMLGLRSFVAALVAAAGSLTTAAFAADLPVRAPTVVSAPASNWTGFYVGGNVGYGWGNNTGGQWRSFSDDPANPFGFAGYFAAGGNVLPGVKPQGVIGGGQIGYDWQFNPNWLAGFVADWQASDMHDSASATVFPPATSFTTQSNSAKLDWFGTVRGRIGYVANDWMLYGTGGLFYGHVKTNVAFDCSACVGGGVAFGGSTSRSEAGWTVGGGVERRLWSNWSIGAEYLYFDLGSVSTTASQTLVTLAGGPTRSTLTANSDFTGHIVRAVLNYKFN